jgi:hypothetical protein
MTEGTDIGLADPVTCIKGKIKTKKMTSFFNIFNKGRNEPH